MSGASKIAKELNNENFNFSETEFGVSDFNLSNTTVSLSSLCASACSSQCASNCGKKCASACSSKCGSLCAGLCLGGGAADTIDLPKINSITDIVL